MPDDFHVLDNAAITRLEVVELGDDHTLSDRDLGKLLRLDKDAVAQTQRVDLTALATDDPFTLIIADNQTEELDKAASMGATIKGALEDLPNIRVTGVTSVIESSTDIYDITFAVALGPVPQIDTTKRATVTTTVIPSTVTAGRQEIYFSNAAGGSYTISLGSAGPSDPLTLSSTLGDIEAEIDALVGSGSVTVTGDGSQGTPYLVVFDVAAPPSGQLVINIGSLTSIDAPTSVFTQAVTNVVMTIPQVGSEAGQSFPVGARVDLVQASSCEVEVVGGTGVTIIPVSNLSRDLGSVVGLVMDRLDEWVLFGDLLEA